MMAAVVDSVCRLSQGNRMTASCMLICNLQLVNLEWHRIMYYFQKLQRINYCYVLTRIAKNIFCCRAKRWPSVERLWWWNYPLWCRCWDGKWCSRRIRWFYCGCRRLCRWNWLIYGGCVWLDGCDYSLRCKCWKTDRRFGWRCVRFSLCCSWILSRRYWTISGCWTQCCRSKWHKSCSQARLRRWIYTFRCKRWIVRWRLHWCCIRWFSCRWICCRCWYFSWCTDFCGWNWHKSCCQTRFRCWNYTFCCKCWETGRRFCWRCVRWLLCRDKFCGYFWRISYCSSWLCEKKTILVKFKLVLRF